MYRELSLRLNCKACGIVHGLLPRLERKKWPRACICLWLHGLSLERYTKNGLHVLSEMGVESCQWTVEGRFIFLYILFGNIWIWKPLLLKILNDLDSLSSFTFPNLLWDFGWCLITADLFWAYPLFDVSFSVCKMVLMTLGCLSHRWSWGSGENWMRTGSGCHQVL